MKLTNYMRDAFIQRVMDDVPKIDYDEQIRKALMVVVLEETPPHVLKVWKDDKTKFFLETRTFYAANVGVTGPYPGGDSYKVREKYGEKFSSDERVKPLADAKVAQDKARDELKQKLKGTAYAFTTRKSLAEALPEFEKYLPPDEAAAIRTLPVVTNVVTDFVKAGWPKDAKKPAPKAVAKSASVH